jgi:Reverse transcriptase (RNA-dependent DNA polymerase)
MGFKPCKAEPDIWMRKKGNLYEYIGSYVDDLAIAAQNPKEIIDELEKRHSFKLKGTGPITFHLGCDFYRDSDNVLCMQPRKYIEKMIETYERLFGMRPSRKFQSPLEKGDHPEMDTSELLDDDGTQLYQSMIGAMQWAVSLARIDIATAVMTLSSFRVAPRTGHLERVKRVYGYISQFKDAAIRFRTDEPDYSDLPEHNFDWMSSVYGDDSEPIPHDIPEPLGKHVRITHYVDANLFHDMLTGRSVTGIIDFLNQTP